MIISEMSLNFPDHAKSFRPYRCRYGAAQNETDPGVLVFSRFIGAALELTGAILINPYDIDGGAHALKTAFDMPFSKRIGRWKPILNHLSEHDAHRRCDEFLGTLASEMAEPLPSMAQRTSLANVYSALQ
jgi:trehalose-6-phosphate synthase